jgi:HEAT repeat protein
MNAMRDDELTQALRDKHASVRLRAIARITEDPATELAPDALAALVGCLRSDAKAVQRCAADALAARARTDGRVVDAVRPLLRSDDARARFGAAYALGVIGAGALGLDALDALCEALSDRDGDVRWAAAELAVRLGRAHPREVRDALVRLAENGAAAAPRMALYCLRDLGAAGDDLRALAVRLSSAADPHVRLAALSLLARLADASDAAAEAVAKRLKDDPEAGVRRAAASALGRVGNRSPRIAAALRRAAEDAGDESLRRAAGEALRRLGLQ